MSMVTGGSSMTRSLPVALIRFDMAKESDVLELLRRVHLSTLTPEEKNHLRDLVFDTRFGTPAPVDEAFIREFASFGFTIAADTVAIAESDTSASAPKEVVTEALAIGRLGSTRLAPHFVSPAVSAVTVAPEVISIPVVAVVPEPLADAVIATPVIEVTPTPLNIESEVSQSEVIQAVVEEEAAPVIIQAAPEPVVVAVSSAIDTTIPPQTSNIAERIAAIKREVNARIGNPVNLIDVNNEIGREYMNALLDAMKKSVGGVPESEVQRAMARLERSFVAVKETLEVQQAAEESAPVISDTPTPSVAQEAVLPQSGYAAVTEEVVDSVTTTPKVTIEDIVIEDRPRSGILSVMDTEMPRTPDQGGRDEGERITIASALQANTTEPIPREEVSRSDLSERVVPTQGIAVAGGITSVAKEKQLKELMQQRKEAEIASAAERAAASSNNPLMADEVTSGLQQLLSEWKLFKSSGIFGTGPSGYEHPLYKTLSQLTMAAVLAGRFEGATPEIKRSITDYMNGWRYEEGITHVAGETFELYLRRVIRHILDTQRNE